MSLVNGVVIGLVTDVNDDGTVKVKFPWLPDDPETDWIRIATTMAGNDRGTFFMPEVDDEVLVAFEHGDTNYPYVVGFLWNGKDKPPVTDKGIRKIKTKSGHILEFNDKNKEKRIYIRTAGEHEFEMKDEEDIMIKTRDGNKITMDSGGITIKSERDVTIEGTNVTIKGTNVTIEAESQLSAIGRPIHLNPW